MKRFAQIGSLSVFMACCQWHAAAFAEEKPLWEVGLGVAAIQFPAYRGAIESDSQLLPMPYIAYRGEYFKADKDGARAVLFGSDLFEVNLSVAASPPASSKNVKARRDMPDLRSSLELGPSLDVKLWRSSGRDAQLKLFVPLRAAVTLERDPRSIGWQLTPRINLDVRNPLGLRGWTLGTVAGPIFGSQAQHAYFYGVKPEYSTAERPAFEAKAGYAGLQVLSALWTRLPSCWVGGFVRYDNLRGAVFENSPLVTRKSGYAGGIAISWIFGQSSQKVTVD
jgi:outer membrane scaffolding protein for murein synthesis (MipA/OmpV family)